MVDYKKCSKCGEGQPIESFFKNRRSKDGHGSFCKECCKKYGEGYRSNNKDIIKKDKKEYYENNKDIILNQRKEYYKDNKDKVIKRVKEYYKSNKDKIKEYNKDYRNNNSNKLLEQGKEYREANRDRLNECKKEYYENNKDKLLEQGKEYREANKDKIAERRKDYFEKYYNSFYDFNSMYTDQLKLYEDIKIAEDNYIMVKCAYCGAWFKPKVREIRVRLYAINGTASGENRFYCSNNCKKACPIFHRQKWPRGFKKATSREVQPELRQMVLERDNRTCQYGSCGKTTEDSELHCHHIEGIHHNPIESADIDICITLCKEHHKHVHKQTGCTYHDMKCITQGI